MKDENASRTNFTQVANAKTPSFGEYSGFDFMHWHVDRSSVSYHRSEYHTLSLYLKGGETSYRVDKKNRKGRPDHFCLMPQDQDFNWDINGPIEFAHLYFSQDLLNHFAVTTFDVDVRFVELRDLLYEDDAELRSLFDDVLLLKKKSSETTHLMLEEKLQLFFHHLLTHYNGFKFSAKPVSGGLSPTHRRVVRDNIEQRLSEKLSIEGLATEIGLSPFHFARMFKVSFGESPANYINRRRVALAKEYLARHESLAQISADSGFSHQSHMTATFKKLTGLTPALYRQSKGAGR
jgi:AraC family transcriptional regulator